MAEFDAVLVPEVGGAFAISPDITAKVLRKAPDGSPVALEVVFAAGARWPGPDVHAESSEAIFVLAGVLRTGIPGSGVNKVDDVCPAGTLVCAEQGTSHEPYSETGCTLLVTYPDKWKGSEPVAA
jgi:hypothetical protein